ncbi:MAG TPA: toxin-antitoxin system, antitoxin component, Xre family protein [Nitrospiraceae bacterium]|nr:toxin-antitoxin system, antitoxin component, Xre family protein [Nitrospiraceae bacterium]
MTVKDMIKNELERLPDNILAEVYDFILFLETKKTKALLAKSYQQLSDSSFEKIWVNEEDAVYDTL